MGIFLDGERSKQRLVLAKKWLSQLKNKGGKKNAIVDGIKISVSSQGNLHDIKITAEEGFIVTACTKQKAYVAHCETYQAPVSPLRELHCIDYSVYGVVDPYVTRIETVKKPSSYVSSTQYFDLIPRVAAYNFAKEFVFLKLSKGKSTNIQSDFVVLANYLTFFSNSDISNSQCSFTGTTRSGGGYPAYHFPCKSGVYKYVWSFIDRPWFNTSTGFTLAYALNSYKKQMTFVYVYFYELASFAPSTIVNDFLYFGQYKYSAFITIDLYNFNGFIGSFHPEAFENGGFHHVSLMCFFIESMHYRKYFDIPNKKPFEDWGGIICIYDSYLGLLLNLPGAPVLDFIYNTNGAPGLEVHNCLWNPNIQQGDGVYETLKKYDAQGNIIDQELRVHPDRVTKGMIALTGSHVGGYNNPHDNYTFLDHNGYIVTWTRLVKTIFFGVSFGVAVGTIVVPPEAQNEEGIRPEIHVIKKGWNVYWCACIQEQWGVRGLYVGSPYQAWIRIPDPQDYRIMFVNLIEYGEDLIDLVFCAILYDGSNYFTALYKKGKWFILSKIPNANFDPSEVNWYINPFGGGVWSETNSRLPSKPTERGGFNNRGFSEGYHKNVQYLMSS